MQAVTRSLLVLACLAAWAAAAAAAVPAGGAERSLNAQLGTADGATIQSSAAPAPEGSALLLTVAFAHGGKTGVPDVPCPTWDADSGSWTVPQDALRHGATGGPLPRRGMIDGISYAICYDATGEPSGKEVRDAVQKGGADAQAAAFAMLRDVERACGTSNPGAADRTYHAAIAPLIADPADVEAAKQWLSNLVAGADAVGIPACASLVLVDKASGQVTEQAQIHTGAS